MKVSIDVDSSGLEKKLEALTEYRELLNSAVDALGDSALQNVMRLTPGQILPTLWNVDKTTDSKGQITQVEITNTCEKDGLLTWMEYGTRQHVIEPKSDNPYGLLFFKSKMTNKWVAAKKVNHPGTKAYLMAHNTIAILKLQLVIWKKTLKSSIINKAEQNV